MKMLMWIYAKNLSGLLNKYILNNSLGIRFKGGKWTRKGRNCLIKIFRQGRKKELVKLQMNQMWNTIDKIKYG